MFKIKGIFVLLFVLFCFYFVSSITLLSSAEKKHDKHFDIIFNSTTYTPTSNLIRQCSCVEESICILSMKRQINDCFDVCWADDKQIKEISASPEHLKTCFAKNEVLLDKFISCLKETHQTCTDSKPAPMIPRVNLEKLLGTGEKRLKSQAQSFLRKMSLDNQKLVLVE
ncbi:hypothetical protein Mgra_00000346 [Meloidogyne graminicola]|uniref:Uncharacterized protein n=1 Tax=Meloidogyne graminicola TaxID=189291 RepID=A0A8T0A6J8_9BILA|nr:hypothetical protein Mgra_00000346 [Meloidogyne graminicola]